MIIQKPRGTRDWIKDEMNKKRFIERSFEDFCDGLGFQKIETPLYEQKNLFVRSVGEQTDIVEKEMFELARKSDETYALRPELTAGIARYLIEDGIKGKLMPIMLYAIGPTFRYDKPQKGRYRQHNQAGIEIFGVKRPMVDIFGIFVAYRFVSQVGIRDLIINLNSFGSTESKKEYAAKLKNYLLDKKSFLCPDCQRRIEKNPLRVLDCKNEQCRQIAISAPTIYDSLSKEEKKYLSDVAEGLEELSIPFNVEPNLVRGLDYYTGIIFEINKTSDKERAYSLGGGGRYDDLIEQLGGPPTPAFGFGLGLERLIEEISVKLKTKKIKVLLVSLSDKQNFRIFKFLNELLSSKASFSIYLREGGLGQALSYANKNKFDFALIAGTEEVENKKFILKNLKTGYQKTLSLSDINQELKK